MQNLLGGVASKSKILGHAPGWNPFFFYALGLWRWLGQRDYGQQRPDVAKLRCRDAEVVETPKSGCTGVQCTSTSASICGL